MADLFWRVVWSILVLPEAVWNTVRDRRTAAFFPPMRCPDVLVDEHAGRVGDLRFGDSLEDVLAQFGPGLVDPPGHWYQRSPTLPHTMDAPPGHGPGERINHVAYADALVYVSARCGVYAVYVWHKRTSTAAGVRIGDRRTRVLERYRDVVCEKVAGTMEHPSRDYCRVQVGQYYLWFGEDPVRSVVIALTPIY